MNKIKTDPVSVYNEYKTGSDYKASLGDKGLFEQAKINARFYSGDQWHGVKSPNDRPLIRRNIIKRIGDYKLSTITSSPIAVNFCAEGISDFTLTDTAKADAYSKIAFGGYDFTDTPDDFEISLMMDFLTNHSQTAMERLGLNTLLAKAIKNAYISGSGIIYTYWDSSLKTGLFADPLKTVPITGDILSEVIEIENVVFGDPALNDIQKQPYIIIAQRLLYSDVIREARQNGLGAALIEKIKPDSDTAHDFNLNDTEAQHVTVYTKLYKEYSKTASDYTVKALRCTADVIIKEPFNIGIKLYPLAKIDWEERKNCIYGDSEITYIIPNQIAINRALSAEVWSTMLNGMPIMLVNGDVVDSDITNDPGQIIKIYGDNSDVAGAVRYVQPVSFATQMIQSVDNLASNTLFDAGANDAALGNVRPDNAAAIIQMREAALQPMQLKQNSYYAFVEEIMRIWTEFWVNLYGERKIKINTSYGTAYVPFHAQRYKDLLIKARVDVGASTLWSTSVVVSSLDSLLKAGTITPLQYLERLPDNIIPNKTGLINELKGGGNL